MGILSTLIMVSAEIQDSNVQNPEEEEEEAAQMKEFKKKRFSGLKRIYSRKKRMGLRCQLIVFTFQVFVMDSIGETPLDTALKQSPTPTQSNSNSQT